MNHPIFKEPIKVKGWWASDLFPNELCSNFQGILIAKKHLSIGRNSSPSVLQVEMQQLNQDIIYLFILFLYNCGPHISAHALPLDDELDFYLKNDFYLLENDLESSLILFLFFKR